jgi:hypothetical protein
MFPIDDTRHGVGGEPGETVVHLHGHKVLPRWAGATSSATCSTAISSSTRTMT